MKYFETEDYFYLIMSYYDNKLSRILYEYQEDKKKCQ